MGDNLSEMIVLFSSVTDKSEMRRLFDDVFTDSEKTVLAKRWYILKELSNGKSQRKIASDMNVSLCNITRGSKVLKQYDSPVRKYLAQINDESHI